MSEEKRSKITKKKIIFLVGLLGVVLTVGLAWWWIKINRIVSTDDARVKGTIVSVSSKLSGRIEKVLVNEDDSVIEGQVIAVIEKSDFEVQVANAQANLSSVRAKLAALQAGNRSQEILQGQSSVAEAQATLDNDQKDYDRAETLNKQGAISAQQCDKAYSALSVAKAHYDTAVQKYSLLAEGPRTEDIQVATAQVEQAEAVLKNAQMQLDYTVIKAPISGIVALKSVNSGQYVVPGQTMFSVVDLGDVWVMANVEETYMGKVCEGQKVDFSVDMYPGRTFHGEVIAVGAATGSQFALLPSDDGSSGNFTKVTQRLPVKIRALDAEPTLLKPGMSVLVDIHIK
ncbi:multidrug resistance efflux pump [Sporomusaceae bacterium BoRhaA]|uniref:HlyD family secretion protein n=1 Tax=Pelorhabdus rhamnosifermentans TaxID=2772457 RepID=UPI001C05EEB4|nr:HlyD family secretion protein [Pelorhabdus rhamnosifermentans]MBU2699716.1 multidrug resistance efflux pump [Pelorhabdus rhamnosifermentans]